MKITSKFPAAMLRPVSELHIFLVIILLNGCGLGHPKPFSHRTEPVTGMEFILIPKGTFEMGDRVFNTDTSFHEKLHPVVISRDFWMAEKEVNQGQWNLIMGNNEPHPDKPSPYRSRNPLYPVVCVSYSDVQGFLKKLNDKSNGYRYRLPTEAEWEYACRAGTTTNFSAGDKLTDALANYQAAFPTTFSEPGQFISHPVNVGSYPPNPWGLFDMHGNAWEWVSDWYAPYPSEKITDPQGPENGTLKVIRGGSWYFGAQFARSAARGTHEPAWWGFSLGFRVVCEKSKY